MSDLDTGTQSGTDPAQSGTVENQGTTGSNDGTESATTASTQSGTESVKPEAKYTEADMEALRNRMRAADQNSAKFQTELQQIRDKDLPALEKLNRDLSAISQERDRLKADVDKSRLENEFLKNNKFKWKNSAAALKLADLSNVEVHEDGSVTGLDRALDALAKTDPYLLDKSEEDKGTETTGSTGVPGTNGRKGETGTDLKKLAVRMPALRSRGLGN
jgi:chromosome segregation ATPase